MEESHRGCYHQQLLFMPLCISGYSPRNAPSQTDLSLYISIHTPNTSWTWSKPSKNNEIRIEKFVKFSGPCCGVILSQYKQEFGLTTNIQLFKLAFQSNLNHFNPLRVMPKILRRTQKNPNYKILTFFYSFSPIGFFPYVEYYLNFLISFGLGFLGLEGIVFPCCGRQGFSLS